MDETGSIVVETLDETPTFIEYVRLPTPEDTEALRQAGIDKLMALGLTEDEAKAIAGI